jgi:hypothetical protein
VPACWSFFIQISCGARGRTCSIACPRYTIRLTRYCVRDWGESPERQNADTTARLSNQTWPSWKITKLITDTPAILRSGKWPENALPRYQRAAFVKLMQTPRSPFVWPQSAAAASLAMTALFTKIISHKIRLSPSTAGSGARMPRCRGSIDFASTYPASGTAPV